MRKNRFLLALIAASMSLAGCGKKDQKPADTPVTPVEPVDPVDPSGGDDDPLTPEQRQNANEFKKVIDRVISMGFDDEIVEACDEYTLAYSEEIAVEGVQMDVITSVMWDLAVIIDQPTVEGVVDFLVEAKEDGSLKDVTYFAVALCKSYFRVAAAHEDETAPVYKYAADYFDKEGVELHENLYGFLDSIVGCAALFTSDEFIEAVGGVYSSEEKQINLASLQDVLNGASGALFEFVSGQEYASYLVNLLFDGVLEFAEENLEIDSEMMDFVKSINVDEIVSTIYSSVELAGFALWYLGSDESPVVSLVGYTNLILAGDYVSLLLNLAFEYFAAIGIGEDSFENLLIGIFDLYFLPPMLVEGVVEVFSSELTDETGVYLPELINEAVTSLGAAISDFKYLADSINAIDAFIVEVVEKTMITFAHYSEEDAAAAASKVDLSEEIDKFFGLVDTFGESLGKIPAEVYEIIADVANGEYAEAVHYGLEWMLELIGSEVSLEDVEGDVMEIVFEVLGVVSYFDSEEFKESCEAVIAVDPTDGSTTVDVDAMKALVYDVGTALEGLLETKDNVINLGDACVDIVKHILLVADYSEEQVEEIFSGFDVDEFVENLFNEVSDLIEDLKAFKDTEEFDVYLNFAKRIAEVFLSGEKAWDDAYEEVVEILCDFLEEFFELNSEKMYHVESALDTPVKIKELVDLLKTFSGGGSALDLFIEVDPNTGARTINVTGFSYLWIFGGMLSNAFADLANDWVVTVEVFEEIVGKLSEADISEACSQVKSVFESIKSGLLQAFAYFSDMSNYSSLMEVVVPYGNLILEGVDLFGKEDVETYDVVSYVVKVLSLFVEAETKEIAITDFAAIEEKVGEAIGVEEINNAIADGESAEFKGHGVAFDVYEKDEVCYIEVTVINEYEIVVESGVVTSVSVEGEVYTYELLSLEDLAELFVVEETAEVVPA